MIWDDNKMKTLNKSINCGLTPNLYSHQQVKNMPDYSRN